MSEVSFNDEYSEGGLKSGSVKSESEDSLLDEDSEPGSALARQLLDALAPAALSKLRRAFRRTKENSRSQDIDRRVEEVMRLAAAEEGIEFAPAPPHTSLALSLDREGFIQAINNIFGQHKYEPHANALFNSLDAWGAGRIWWRQLLARLLVMAPPRWTPPKDITVKKLQHCKRETIVKLVTIETTESFCYAAVTRGGRVGLYDGRLKLLHSYEVFYDRTGVRKRVKNCWITDAIYMSDSLSFLLAASDRSLAVYDASTLAHALRYCITGLPHIPTCVAYLPSSLSSYAELALGTARGDIVRVRFRHSLPAADTATIYFWREISSPPHTSYISITTWRRVHTRAVRRLGYSGNVVWSCSHDSDVSVRARHMPGKLDDYVFKVQRGVSCFHVIPALHMLATGSADGTVRLWDITQPSPFAKLPSPGRAAVLDVKVIADMEVVVAFCNNCWLHIWDLNEESLLQTIKIKFPFLGVLGKKVEFGAYCIHPGPALKRTVAAESPSTSRGSSVARGSSGGLQLLEEEEEEIKDNRDVEYSLSHRAAIVVTCCDCVCTIPLTEPAEHRPPPGDTLQARRPHAWDVPMSSTDTSTPRRHSLRPSQSLQPSLTPRSRTPRPHGAHTPRSRTPRPLGAHTPRSRSRTPFDKLPELPVKLPIEDLDLEKLLENAGLQGILEKDFVLMKGLKHDLNMKLAEMEANREAMASAVAAGAPYLALRTYEMEPIAPVDEMTDAYARAMRLFPPSSTVGTPTGSTGSTPRRGRSRTSTNV
ncbi:uncharacterized protein LOC133516598 [Cydia pomonella]|uniref:uncharacterized protein LOC133516598 n=1 Tax=Cydia pomonella TaxID=82600 RepID=UPI002ADD359C|nr:uncharacterized protein LOC133516598 [Cydia pomonella]